jgi:hypothetical protein
MEPTRVEVTPRAGAWVEPARLRSAVRNAGFKPGAVRCRVSGTLMERQGRLAVRLSGSERVLTLEAEPAAREAYDQAQQVLTSATEKTVEVEGQLMEPAKAEQKTAATLRVSRLEMSG